LLVPQVLFDQRFISNSKLPPLTISARVIHGDCGACRSVRRIETVRIMGDQLQSKSHRWNGREKTPKAQNKGVLAGPAARVPFPGRVQAWPPPKRESLQFFAPF
jgi:hypothetical protein